MFMPLLAEPNRSLRDTDLLTLMERTDILHDGHIYLEGWKEFAPPFREIGKYIKGIYMSHGCVLAAMETRSHRCGGWTLAMVDHIAMVYIRCVCVCGLVMVIYVVSFNCKSCFSFLHRGTDNSWLFKESMCESVRER